MESLQGTSSNAEPFYIEKLDLKKHDRSAFNSGSEPLDEWFQRQAGQQMRSHSAVVYVLIERSTGIVVGFYTLSACTLAPSDVSPELAKKLKLPRYPNLPAVLLGRLAVDERFKRRGLGKVLLSDAILKMKQLLDELGAVALVVDAKDEAATTFYKHFNFIAFESHPMKLFLPAATIASL